MFLNLLYLWWYLLFRRRFGRVYGFAVPGYLGTHFKSGSFACPFQLTPIISTELFEWNRPKTGLDSESSSPSPVQLRVVFYSRRAVSFCRRGQPFLPSLIRQAKNYSPRWPNISEDLFTTRLGAFSQADHWHSSHNTVIQSLVYIFRVPVWFLVEGSAAFLY